MKKLEKIKEHLLTLHVPFRIYTILVYHAAADRTVYGFWISLLQVNFFFAGRTEVPIQAQ